MLEMNQKSIKNKSKAIEREEHLLKKYNVKLTAHCEKYRIPYDYSVCGFDNTMISQYRRISMTSVENFDVNRGREAVDVLIRKIEAGNRNEEQEPPSLFRVAFASRLIARGSTGPNRRKKE